MQKALGKAGFVDFQEEIIKCYVCPWSSSLPEKEIGRWFNLCLTNGLEAMSLAPMIEGLNMTKEQVVALCARVRNELCILRFHGWLRL